MNHKHGEAKSRLNNIYYTMRQRCNNPNSKSYKDYGLKGISVCKEWDGDYIAFSKWAKTNGYKEHLTIDRKDGTLGYSPENCRWVTYNTQAQNKSKPSTNKSGYKGVSNSRRKENPWTGRIMISGNAIALGSYKTAIDAAIAYDQYIIEHKLEHTRNFNGRKKTIPD